MRDYIALPEHTEKTPLGEVCVIPGLNSAAILSMKEPLTMNGMKYFGSLHLRRIDESSSWKFGHAKPHFWTANGQAREEDLALIKNSLLTWFVAWTAQNREAMHQGELCDLSNKILNKEQDIERIDEALDKAKKSLLKLEAIENNVVRKEINGCS
jgi:hypothetical protein